MTGKGHETAHAELVPTAEKKSGSTRLRLGFLDGLRGVASLYVLAFHIRLNAGFEELPAWTKWIDPPVVYGHFGVCLFIVLSGFCLMLPVVRSRDGVLQGGLWGFVKRRSRRILPPYYAALALSFLWMLFYEGAKLRSGHPTSFSHEFSAANLLSHLLLVFNLFPQYWGATNGNLWSVASEWQIYFVFALGLLPVWRRFGSGGALLLAAVLGVGTHYLPLGEPVHVALDRACSWFILLFAFGMAAAAMRFSPRNEPVAGGRSWPWGRCCLGICAVLAGIAVLWHPVDNPWAPELLRHYTWMTDVLAGMAAVCLILFCARSLDLEGGPARFGKVEWRVRRWLLTALESRAAVVIGGFSYSLYLVHRPVLSAWLYVLTHAPVPPVVKFLLMWIGGGGVSLVGAYWFSRWFEQPFLSKAGPAKVAPLPMESALAAVNAVS